MTSMFDVQGFGALSEFNGQFGSASAAQAFQNIAALGSNSVELTVRIWTQDQTSNTVIADPAKTESDASLLAGFQAAEAAGLSVVFKPNLTGLDGTISSSLAPSDPAAFFASYQAEIVHLATIAQEGGVTTFAIGNELSGLTGAQYESEWSTLITAVRQVYHGQITYAAATDEASHVSFWNQVDVIGVNTYPPLTSSETPTVQDLVNAWTQVPYNQYYAAAFDYKSPVDFLHSLSEQYGKQVLMTEVGYRSIDGTAINPGSGSTNVTENDQAQADAYNAFLQVWTAQGGSWMQGVEFWQWNLSQENSTTGYSPEGKPAADLVSQYFHGNGPVPNLNVTGSSVADVIDLGNGNDTINGGLGGDLIRGGGGNDTIVGGPDVTAKLATTTLTLTGYGTTVNGVSAQVELLVNGNPVSGILTLTPATDPSGYQTYTVTFANTGPITSLDIELVNSAPGISAHIKDFTVNGVELDPTEATNASSPGTFDLYVRTIHFDTTAHQDWFTGGSDNDVITGGGGDDVIDGGGGIDTAVYSGSASQYTITRSGDQIIVTDNVANRDGTDTLTNIEVLKFADGTSIATSSIGQSDSSVPAALPGDTVSFSTDGTVETIRHADGTRDAYHSAINGQPYISEHDIVNAAGHTTTIDQYFADGNLSFQQMVNSDGSINQTTYDSDGHLTTLATNYSDGSFDQFAFNTAGTQTSETVRHADGTRDIYNSNITGQDYTSQHITQDASGHSVLIEDMRADGTMSLQQTVDTAGVKTLNLYDSAGHISQQTVTQTSGAYLQTNYASDGTTVTSDVARAADGTRQVDTFGITGQAYTAQHNDLDAAGHLVSTTLDNTDGSHTMTAFASGVTLTSTTANDVLNGAAAGGDTFAFKAPTGNDVINNFKGGDVAGHDVIQIDSTTVDLAQLSTHVEGQNTVIDLGHDATITLTGYVAPVTAHDVLIV